jgi:oligopeptide/dipeptide ABC transporter ATP-binding protein
MSDEPLLSIRDLSVDFHTPDGVLSAVDHVSYDVYPGETVGVVGESGSGKSVAVQTVLGLTPTPPARIRSGEIRLGGRDLLQLSQRQMRRVRGREIAMVFQDPMTSLNPVMTVGRQIDEAVQVHTAVSDDEARARSVELLHTVGVGDAERRCTQYPHELSGGLRQRAMIAMAMANQPRVLIADEPTTALDVTIQAQVLELLETTTAQTGAGTILITHDLGLIAELCDRVIVMYAGTVVESGDVTAIFHTPRHPYTVGLMASLPRLDAAVQRLEPIPGSPPSLLHPPPGCSFHPRCRLGAGRERCRQEAPALRSADTCGHLAACHYSEEIHAEISRVEATTGSRLSQDG